MTQRCCPLKIVLTGSSHSQCQSCLCHAHGRDFGSIWLRPCPENFLGVRRGKRVFTALIRRPETQAAGESACRPGSVHPLARAGGHPSGTAVAGSLVRSTREHRAGRPRTLAQAPHPEERGALLTLLQVGFTKPPGSLRALVVSYTTVSPLPMTKPKTWPRAVCFLWHYPAGHPGSALPTTLPCGARTFLTGSWNP
jgi:hypothetical protein